MSIIGETIDGSVALQIGVRQRTYGKQKRDNTDLTRLNNTNTWLKLASSVRVIAQTQAEIDASTDDNKVKSVPNYNSNTGKWEEEEKNISQGEQRLRDIGLDNTATFTGNQLAKKAVLFNTLSELSPLGNSYISRSGVSKTNSLWNNSSYGLGGTNFGLSPAPGLISAKIDCKNRGSIREATVELKAYNLFQFELIELLYLRLGYSMLLEWGWDKYLDRNEKLQSTGNTLIEDLWFEDSDSSYRSIIKKIAEYRNKYENNYDGFLGKVVNFDWSFQPDGTYNITLKLITIGDVIESLKVNLPSSLTTPAKLDAVINNGNSFSNTLLDLKSPIVNNAGSSTLSLDLYNDISSSKPEKWWVWKGNYFSWFLNLKEYEEFTIVPNEEEESDDKADQFPPTGVDANKYTYFLTFSALLEKLNKLCVPSLNGTKVLEFDLSGDTICSAFPNQISFNPKVCLIKPQFTENISITNQQDYQSKPIAVKNDHGSFAKLKDFFQVETDTNVMYGSIMNIYLNYDFLSTTLKQNTNDDGETSIYKFLEEICSGINSSLGGLNKLEPILEDDNIIKIIDQNPIPGIEKSKEFGNRMDQTIPFEIYGFSPSGSVDPKTKKPIQTSNFVRDFGFKTKIGPELASMITIGATAENKSTKNYDGTAFSKWNDGLRDAYATKYDDPKETKLEEVVNEAFPLTTANLVRMSSHWKSDKCVIDESTIPDWMDFLGWCERPQPNTKIYGIENKGVKDVEECPITHRDYDNVTWREYVREAKAYLERTQSDKTVKIAPPNPLTNYLGWLLKAFGGNENGNFTYSTLYFHLNNDFNKIGKELFKGFINAINNQVYNESKTPSNTIGFIPADLNLTIEGLSGVKIYNALAINQRFLPKQYPLALNFIITKVNHEISNNDWSTSFSTVSVPKTQAFDSSLIEVSLSTVLSDYQQQVEEYVPITDATKKTNIEIVATYLKAAGVTQAGATGIIGNMLAESGVDPTRLEKVSKSAGYSASSAIGGKGGFGLIQWTGQIKDGKKRRRRKFEDAAGSNVEKRNDINFQLQYFEQETKKDYPRLWNVLTSTNDVATATEQFLVDNLRPASYGERNDSAAAMEKYRSKLRGRIAKSFSAQEIVAKIYEGPIYNPGAYRGGAKF